jgi:hypothetical protein
MFESIKKFWGPVKGSEKGAAKTEEVGRASVFGVVSGVTFWTIVSMIWEVAHAVITDPSFSTVVDSLRNEKNVMAILITFGAFVFDVLRRTYLHGK